MKITINAIINGIFVKKNFFQGLDIEKAITLNVYIKLENINNACTSAVSLLKL